MNRNDFDGSSEDVVIARISFTAKPGVSDGVYQVGLTNIAFTSGDDQIFNVPDNNIDIKVN